VRAPRLPDDPRHYIGQLHELPGVVLAPIEVPLSEFWDRAPAALQARAREPLGPIGWALLEGMRTPGVLDTEVIARVPVWVARHGIGFVLDFLFPEYGVNIQVDAWEPRYLDDDVSWMDELDFDAEPDHPCHDDRDAYLNEELGIECLHFWDIGIEQMGIPVALQEFRYTLGIGRPMHPGRGGRR